MSEEATGSTLLTEGGGNPAESTNSAPAANTQAASPQQNGSQSWRDDLPDDLKGHPSLGKFTDKASFAKSYINLEQLLGSEKIPVPKSEDDVEGYERVYKALGRPEAPDKYDIAVPEVPKDLQGINYDPAEEKYWRELAHKNGLSQKQFKNMWDAGVKTRFDSAINWAREQKEGRDKGVDALKREWGQNFDRNVELAKIGLNSVGDPGLIKYLDDTGLGNDPNMVRAFAKVGRALNGESKLNGAPAKTGPSQQDVQRQIIEYRTKNNKALMDKSDPNHDFHVKHLQRLFEVAYGE